MGELLWGAFFSICGAFFVVKLLGTLWCLVELRRKWRSVPELWALDWLDIVYRVEHEFGVTLTAAEFEGLPPRARAELTAGHLWKVVAARLRGTDSAVPLDGWARLVAVLSEALNLRSGRVTPGCRLYADLGMTPGLE